MEKEAREAIVSYPRFGVVWRVLPSFGVDLKLNAKTQRREVQGQPLHPPLTYDT
jgi:hypothetical protein